MNTTNSTLPTLDIGLKLISMTLDKFAISKSLAHEELLLFSPVSVGILPSNRTLVVGVLQLEKVSLLRVTLEQCPTGDEPFNDTVLAVGKMKLDGTTKGIK